LETNNIISGSTGRNFIKFHQTATDYKDKIGEIGLLIICRTGILKYIGLSQWRWTR